MDAPSLYAIGAFIQALSQNASLEKLLQELGPLAHVYIGTGLGAVETMYRLSISHFVAQQRWNRFWARAENNSALRFSQGGEKLEGEDLSPPEPEAVSEEQQEEARLLWESYWAAKSQELRQYLDEAAEIDALVASGDIEQGKLQVLWEEKRRQERLSER